MTTRSEAAPAGGPERQGLDADRVHPHCTRPPYLYLAASLDAREDSVYYPACLRLAEFAYPELDVVEGIREFDGQGDWQSRHRALIRNANRLVCVPRPDGTIGAGVMREIVEAVFCHVPVHVATPGHLIPLEAVTFRFPRCASWDLFAIVTMGGR
jgi:hypothetical protein